MARWLIEKAGVQITVKTNSEAATQLVTVALSAMDAELVSGVGKTTRGIKLSVEHKEDAWHLCDHSNNLRRKLKNSGDLIYHLTDRIVFHIADKAIDTHCLHAASVARGSNALVIPANSGDGKSSFTTWLVANGFAYLTDELILVNSEQQVEGIARPIQIKAHGIHAVEHLFKDKSLVHEGKFANAVPIDALAGAVSAQPLHKLRLFVFPRYRKESSYQLTQLSSAEAGMQLMANHVNARSLEGHGFREMMAIIRNTPCYALEYGGFDTLPNNFTDVLNELLAEH